MTDQKMKGFISACSDVAARGLVSCSSGNLSWRLDRERLMATASRSWLERLGEDEISICRIADASLISGGKPTVEIGFHAGIMRARPDVNVVLHFQTPCATTLACRNAEINYFVIPEIPFYIGRIAKVPYLSPGSPELAEAVTTAMQDHNMVIMQNHGLVTVAEDQAHALQNAVFFELACRVIVQGGEPLQTADSDHLLSLRDSTQKNV